MTQWFSSAELAGLPGLPKRSDHVARKANREGWPSRPRMGRGGGLEYDVSCAQFPPAARHELAKRAHTAAIAAEEAERELRAQSLHDSYAAKPQAAKDAAERRRRILLEVERIAGLGTKRNDAVAQVAKQSGHSARTIWNWFGLVRGLERQHWDAALAPRYFGGTTTAACSEAAWEYFKGDYLRPSRPCIEAVYDRLQRAAEENGWTIPSAKALKRRLDREMTPAAIALARDGNEAMRGFYPYQQRDADSFRALEAVNADGHKWDIMVRFADGRIGRPVTVMWQDIHSRKLLAWRSGESEHAGLIRLSFADLVATYGIPEHAYFDNGRAFASKWITGGSPTRYRFKVRDEDPLGVLSMLQVQVHWTRPYSGRSKPVERGFRDLAERVARHPAFEKAYIGNRPDARPESYDGSAVDWETFERVLADEVAAHNARDGRRTDTADGASFDATFAESYAGALIRRASERQLHTMLLAADSVTAKRKSGEIVLYGNRYWSESRALARIAGTKVTVRFDPDHLDRPVHVYRLDGSFVATCERIEKAGFDDVEAARAHARDFGAWKRAQREMLDRERSMNARQVAALIPSTTPAPAPETKTIRLHTARKRRPVEADRPAEPGAFSITRIDERVRAHWEEEKKRLLG